MDEQVLLPSESSGKEVLISKNNFIILNFFTFNLYSTWWTYKSWRYFKEKENLDIEPALRALFSIFFLYGLFEKIKGFALEKSYPKSYSSILLYLGILLFSVLSFLPALYYLVALMTFIFYTPAVDALNYAIKNSEDHNFELQISFNTRQIVLLVIGGGFWLLIVLGLLAP